MFRKYIFSVLTLLLPVSTQAFENKSEASIETHSQPNLIAAVDLYIEFLNQANSWSTSTIGEQVPGLCALECRKIVNGKVVFENRECYAEQLAAVKKEIGAYVIEPLQILTPFKSRVAIVQHLVHTENTGCQIVFVILKYNSEYLITEINEVYNRKD